MKTFFVDFLNKKQQRPSNQLGATLCTGSVVISKPEGFFCSFFYVANFGGTKLRACGKEG